MDQIKIRRAVLSVSNKDGLLSLARILQKWNVELFASGGTELALREAGISVSAMSNITGNPEAFGGRMKTISFPFASGLLYRRGLAEDEATAKQLQIPTIDLVVCNLYPFAEALASGAAEAELIEQIDIGGPLMVRAAAKNHAAVAIATDPSQYAQLAGELEEQAGALSLNTRRNLAAAAFRMTARYETMIADALAEKILGETNMLLSLERGKVLRYGENPHQKASFYRWQQEGKEKKPSRANIAGADIIQGKALSYNNLLDADAAHRVASDAWWVAQKNSAKCTVAVIKHLNPCGLAVAASSLSALELAWAGDPVSAFGGILCFSHEFDLACAEWLDDKFVEVIIAPSIAAEAIPHLAKKKNLRVLLCPPAAPQTETTLRSVSGGVLVQEEDIYEEESFRLVTKNKMPAEFADLLGFGVVAAKHLRSNAIALVTKSGSAWQLVGAGMGQPNRIDSLQILAAPRAKAKISLANTVLVSDAFFPFADMIAAAKELGIRAIVQPGGSIRDEEVIAAADAAGIAMVFTGKRHFRH